MTQHDIYKKFLIEYDKANVTSSYPSLTRYEALTILDKAYLALVGLKFTGNNVRKVEYEKDTKSVSDLQQLNITAYLGSLTKVPSVANEAFVELPSDFLFAVGGYIMFKNERRPMQMITHEMAKRFEQTYANKPWIKYPVYYIEDNRIYILYDMSTFGSGLSIDNANDFGIVLDYIRIPNKFAYSNNDTIDWLPYLKLLWLRDSALSKPADIVSDRDKYENVKNAFEEVEEEYWWIDFVINSAIDGDSWQGPDYFMDIITRFRSMMLGLTTFELNDAMAEELISLAVTFALENVESTRLNTKLNTRGLEA